MKKIISIWLSIALAFTIIGGCNSPEVQAASKNSKAKAAFAKVMANESGLSKFGILPGEDVRFAKADINGDGVTELFVTTDGGYHVSILAYVNGKVKSVGDGFAGQQKYCKSKKLYYSFTAHTGSETEYYYRFDGKTMKELCYYTAADAINSVTQSYFQIYTYYVNGKKVTKKVYNKYVKQLLGNSSLQNPKYVKNSKENRNRYL